MSKVFIDTNILIYAYDSHAGDKREYCRNLLRSLRNGDTGVISTQVLQEFYVVSLKKLGVDPIHAKAVMHSFRNYEVVSIDPDLIEEAVDCSLLGRLSFWDALIVVSAEKARCERLLTEDLNHGQVIRGVRVENPFYRGTDRVNEARNRTEPKQTHAPG